MKFQIGDRVFLNAAFIRSIGAQAVKPEDFDFFHAPRTVTAVKQYPNGGPCIVTMRLADGSETKAAAQNLSKRAA